MKAQRKALNRRETYWEWGFLVFIFLFYLIWSCCSPFDSAPDERMRYDIPKFIYETGRLPLGQEEAIRDEVWGISYAFNPILSYMISALFMKAASIFSKADYVLLMAARMVSILFGTGTAWLTIKISKKLLTGSYRWLFICLVTLLPQMAYTSTYVNNDAMAIFSTAWIFYMWILGLETDWNWQSCLGLAVGVSLCTLSYYNAYGFILCSIVFFAFTCSFCTKKSPDFKTMWKKGLGITIIVLIFAGWWFIRNAILYQNDFLGMKTSSYYAQLYAQDPFKPSNRMTYQKMGVNFFQMLLSEGWFHNTKYSFIACFGYATIDLPGPLYHLYLIPFGLGVFGVLLRFSALFRLRREKRWVKKNILHLCMLTAVIIPFILSAYYSYVSDYQPQGRYILPCLLPAMYFVVIGLKELLLPFMSEKTIIWMCRGYCVVLAALAIFSFAGVFYPAYH